MTARRPCPPAPGPLEDYATQFDPLLASVAQRRGLRDDLQGLLLPRDRNKTLTALADAEPITGAQHREVQRLQWFLSESTWDHEQVNKELGETLDAGQAGLVAVYETSLADQVAANIKAANRVVSKVTDMEADQLAADMKQAEQENAALP
jgi:DDE superfamily endonuclease